ncbi:hypothetical protein PanNE5_32770 [Pandoraea sp. NE5]|nr:hypothetical protein PanNE5_32770 [Pandoraea sp. NE5]
MGLVTLELLERRQVRIAVVEPNDETDRHLMIRQVVEERAAVGLRVERPAGRVDDETFLVLGRVDFPQFLDAQAVGLRIAAFVEIELAHQLATQAAPCAFREDRVLGVQFHAQLEVLGRFAVLADAHVAGRHAHDRAVLVVQDLGGREAREDFNAQRFGLLSEPAHDIAQADDIVAVILEAGGQQPRRRGGRAGLVQEQEAIFNDRGVERCTKGFPVGDEFGQRLRIHDRARQDVRPDFRAFFQDTYGNLLPRLLRALLQTDCRGQAGRTAANNDDVILHRLPRAVLLKQLGIH